MKDLLSFGKEYMAENTFSVKLSPNATEKQYVQIKMTQFDQEGVKSTMLQVIDISTTIMLDEQKADNKLLDIINATVSHEMRNPLNSIIAQNMENEQLLAEV